MARVSPFVTTFACQPESTEWRPEALLLHAVFSFGFQSLKQKRKKKEKKSQVYYLEAVIHISSMRRPGKLMSMTI